MHLRQIHPVLGANASLRSFKLASLVGSPGLNGYDVRIGFSLVQRFLSSASFCGPPEVSLFAPIRASANLIGCDRSSVTGSAKPKRPASENLSANALWASRALAAAACAS